ncbi:MAG: SPOR domain-containing protein [Paludibacteraceae bacterium]|nr:SPOR domain-containing protein [Paludibacteraceae bacterium]
MTLKRLCHILIAATFCAAWSHAEDKPLTHTQDTTFSIVRTDEKIIPIERFHAPYTIQVAIMKAEPSTPLHFDEAGNVLLVKGVDGWNRYYVGQYGDRQAAQQMLSLLKPIYPDAFVATTQQVAFRPEEYIRTYVREAEIRSVAAVGDGHRCQRKADSTWTFGGLSSDSLIECPYQSLKAVEPDPRQSYSVQLIVTRYPLHENEIVEFRNVQEYYMPADRYFRYATSPMPYREAEKILQKALRAGFFDAVIVDSRIYAPFLVL